MDHSSARWARHGCSLQVFTGISKPCLGELIAELAPRWADARDGHRDQSRGHARMRAPGAGRGYALVFTDRVLVTLIGMRLGLPHAALASMFGCSPQTVDAAVLEVRPLLASRGFGTPIPGPRLHTLADVFAYAQANDVALRLDGTEIRVRRPNQGYKGRRRFVSGKMKMNSIKATVICDQDRNLLWVGAIVPGRMHDQTAVKHHGIESLLDWYPGVEVLVDAGYRGLAKAHPDQVVAPPAKPKKDPTAEQTAAYEKARFQQSSARIPVEQTIGAQKRWRTLQRWNGRRETLPEVILAVAGLASQTAAA